MVAAYIPRFVTKIEKVGTQSGSPSKTVVVTDCGQL